MSKQDLGQNSIKSSLTYLIYNGYFNEARRLIDKNECDLDETDESWIQKYQKMMRKKKPVTSSTQEFGYKGHMYGRTALMMCCLIEDDSWAFSLAQNLIEKGANIGLRDSFGFNALMYTCLYERQNLFELFYNSPGEFSLYSKDQFGNTCFHLAGLTKTDAICNHLRKIVHKFNLPHTVCRNKFNHSPIDLCRLNNHETCIGLDFFSEHFRLNESNDLTPFQESTDNNKPKLNSKSAIISNSSTPDWLEFYKFISNIKEPLIKEYKPKNQIEHRVVNDYIEFKNAKSAPKCVITRSLNKNPEHYDLIKRDNERVVSETKKLSRNNLNKSSDIDINQPWRDNLLNLYETLEFQNTRSFRKTMNQSPTNLFDQVATGLLLNLHLSNFVSNDSRRNSLLKTSKSTQITFNLVNNNGNNNQQQSNTSNNNSNNKARPSINNTLLQNNANSSNLAQSVNSGRRTSVLSSTNK